MGKQISYFTNYHGKENIVTNYCGVMLKMIYDESPKAFEKIINAIVADCENYIDVGPRFTQQEKHKSSIPDLIIRQKSFNVFFENKISDWFYGSQLDNYIANLDDTSSVNVLILLSNEFSNTDLIKSISEKGQDKNVCVTHITYEDLVELIEENVTSFFLLTQLTEFRAFLDQEGLLPKWKYRLDVVNCAAVSLNLGDDRAYLCADTGGAYSHQRARFFGAYKDKKVHHLYTISAVVTVPENLGVPRLKWKNDDSMSDEDLMSIAKELVSKYRRDENASTPLQVFILDNEREVSFIKDTAGGLWGSKVYFHEIARDCKTIDELADYINNKVWSSINEKKS